MYSVDFSFMCVKQLLDCACSEPVWYWSNFCFCAIQQTLPLSFSVSLTLSLSASVSPFCIFSLSISLAVSFFYSFSVSGSLSLSLSLSLPPSLLLFCSLRLLPLLLILSTSSLLSPLVRCCSILYCTFLPGKIKRIWDGRVEGGSRGREGGWRMKNRGSERKTRENCSPHPATLALPGRKNGGTSDFCHSEPQDWYFFPLCWGKSRRKKYRSPQGPPRCQATPGARGHSGRLGVSSYRLLPWRPNTFQSWNRWIWIEMHRDKYLFVKVPSEVARCVGLHL